MIKNKTLIIPIEKCSINTREYENFDDIEVLVLHNGITEIQKNAFKNCKNLKRIVFSNNLKYIGEGAFSGCQSLENVVLNSKLLDLQISVFEECISLKKVIIHADSLNLGEHAFKGCRDLQIVYLNPKMNSITLMEGCFQHCESLMEVVIPSALSLIPRDTFLGCTGFKIISLGKHIKKIGEYAFSGCTSLEKVELPRSLKELQNSIFENCASLTTVLINKNLTRIGDNSFAGCSKLRNVYFYDKILSIDDSAFNGCHPKLTFHGEINDVVLAFKKEHKFSGSKQKYPRTILTKDKISNLKMLPSKGMSREDGHDIEVAYMYLAMNISNILKLEVSDESFYNSFRQHFTFTNIEDFIQLKEYVASQKESDQLNYDVKKMQTLIEVEEQCIFICNYITQKYKYCFNEDFINQQLDKIRDLLLDEDTTCIDTFKEMLYARCNEGLEVCGVKSYKNLDRNTYDNSVFQVGLSDYKAEYFDKSNPFCKQIIDIKATILCGLDGEESNLPLLPSMVSELQINIDDIWKSALKNEVVSTIEIQDVGDVIHKLSASIELSALNKLMRKKSRNQSKSESKIQRKSPGKRNYKMIVIPCVVVLLIAGLFYLDKREKENLETIYRHMNNYNDYMREQNYIKAAKVYEWVDSYSWANRLGKKYEDVNYFLEQRSETISKAEMLTLYEKMVSEIDYAERTDCNSVSRCELKIEKLELAINTADKFLNSADESTLHYEYVVEQLPSLTKQLTSTQKTQAKVVAAEKAEEERIAEEERKEQEAKEQAKAAEDAVLAKYKEMVLISDTGYKRTYKFSMRSTEKVTISGNFKSDQYYDSLYIAAYDSSGSLVAIFCNDEILPGDGFQFNFNESYTLGRGIYTLVLERSSNRVTWNMNLSRIW